jgi:hypothetical protein
MVTIARLNKAAEHNSFIIYVKYSITEKELIARDRSWTVTD